MYIIFQTYITELIETINEVYMLNQLSDLLSPADLFLYNNADHQLATTVLRRELDKKLKEEPDYEVWLPLKYWKYNGNNTVTTSPYITAPHIIISNKGRVLNTNNETHTKSVNDTGYLIFKLRVDGRLHVCYTHRAVGCLFVPLPDKLCGTPLIKLEVNHIDGNKQNPIIDNLEWSTKADNLLHSKINGLRTYGTGLKHHNTKPLTFTVIDHELMKNEKFLVIGLGMAKSNYVGMAKDIAGKGKKYKGCIVTHATDEEIKTLKTIDEIDKKLIQKFKELSGK